LKSSSDNLTACQGRPVDVWEEYPEVYPIKRSWAVFQGIVTALEIKRPSGNYRFSFGKRQPRGLEMVAGLGFEPRTFGL
jgi:hypothetical protein